MSATPKGPVKFGLTGCSINAMQKAIEKIDGESEISVIQAISAMPFCLATLQATFTSRKQCAFMAALLWGLLWDTEYLSTEELDQVDKALETLHEHIGFVHDNEKDLILAACVDPDHDEDEEKPKTTEELVKGSIH